MRVVFLGNAISSVASLEALARSDHDVGLVVTRVPRPAGRGGGLRPTPVAVAARRLGLPLHEVETVKDDRGISALRDATPDALAVVAYGEILPPDVLGVPRTAAVNLHFSLLPALRGADPVRRAILDGLDVTGVTTIAMDEGMDTGPILLQRSVPIGREEDAGSLGGRLAEVGAELLVETFDGLRDGTVRPRAQREEGASRAPKLRREDEWIEWDADAGDVLRRIRALAPEPAARTAIGGRVVKVLRGHRVDLSGEPGTIIAVAPLAVAARGGAVAFDRVVPAGSREMSGEEFVRGARVEPGMRADSALA